MEKRVGEYFITEEVLGRGAFSTVYSGYSLANRKLAVKVIPRHNIREGDFVFFQREINLLKKCPKQWVVDFLDFKKSKSNFYIFLQYCDGGNLAEYINQEKRLSEAEALRIFSQLVKGMSSMRSMNIIHRDLKPANIMLKNGNIKIVDFGLARKFYHGEMMRTVVGSPFNMAPQILQGKPYTEKVDVYSAGTILYEMLYGISPFEARNKELLIKQISRRKFQKGSEKIEISDGVLTLLREMLQPQPSKRIDLTEILDFVQSYERELREKKIKKYQQVANESKKYYGVFSSIAAPFINNLNEATPKQPINLDMKLCVKLINKMKG